MNPPPSLRPRAVEQFAAAYAFADRTIVITYGHIPGENLLVQGAMCLTVRQTATMEVLGYAVLQALESFLPGYILPDDYADQRKKQLQALGVRSEREIQRQAKFCSFRRTPEVIVFQPTHNGGHKGERKGFQPLPQAVITIPERSELVEVGVALQEAFKRCTTVFG